jgi:hypothetical protein
MPGLITSARLQIEIGPWGPGGGEGTAEVVAIQVPAAVTAYLAVAIRSTQP